MRFPSFSKKSAVGDEVNSRYFSDVAVYRFITRNVFELCDLISPRTIAMSVGARLTNAATDLSSEGYKQVSGFGGTHDLKHLCPRCASKLLVLCHPALQILCLLESWSEYHLRSNLLFLRCFLLQGRWSVV